MIIRLPNGIVLNTEGGYAKNATDYAKRRGLNGYAVVVANHPEGWAEYLVLNQEGTESIPVYSSQSYEAICVWIDMMTAFPEGKEHDRPEAT